MIMKLIKKEGASKRIFISSKFVLRERHVLIELYKKRTFAHLRLRKGQFLREREREGEKDSLEMKLKRNRLAREIERERERRRVRESHSCPSPNKLFFFFFLQK